ncbi:MAG: ImmA/IrrE family metallo-endopeptidase [Chthonomonadaceae bacterium]|nr:ImmA/IrrE family metallo-endopeptidase [Chthonomonadaceae bacterium]
MTPNLPNDAPELLSEFVKFYEEENSILCNVPPEEFARCFRIHFEIPFPMGMPDASIMVQNMEDIKFYIQPGLENKLNIRGFWISKGSSHIILVDAERPDPSKIKTVIHELSEQILTISHNLHPEILKRSDKSREQFVNAVAAHVKMPSEKFRKQIECFGLDVEQLTQANNDTLAGVARHIRDLVMS